MSIEPRVIPVLVYADIAAAHDFLVSAFGFTAGGLSHDAQGVVNHGEVSVGGQAIWLHRVTDAHAMAAATDGRSSGGLVVYVDDVDAHYERARAAGAHVDAPPRDQLYGQREYGARDSEGHRWWFATRLPSAPA